MPWRVFCNDRMVSISTQGTQKHDLAIGFFNSNQTLTNATSPCGIGSLANTDEGAFTPPGRLEPLCSAEPLTADNFDLEAQ